MKKKWRGGKVSREIFYYRCKPEIKVLGEQIIMSVIQICDVPNTLYYSHSHTEGINLLDAYTHNIPLGKWH